jgi:hypothetical protein
MESKEEIKLKIVLKYLHECLQNEVISEQTELLKQVGIDISWRTVGKTSDLTEIRDNLLSQVNFSKKS